MRLVSEEKLAEGFMLLFDGMKTAFGTYSIPTQKKDANKKIGVAATHRAKLEVKHWQEHLDGKIGLGVIPINDASECRWGAIDIDQYSGFEPAKLARRMAKENIPFVICRSKSGGAHAYLFLTEAVDAGDLREKLLELSSGLGYGGSEIFPKQIKVLVERGDVPNWINMPYFQGKRTNRHGYSDEGEVLEPHSFLEFAESKRISSDALLKLSIEADKKTIEDGPPCLQFLVTQGFPEGVRNRSLFNLGVYARKRWPDREEWISQVNEYNKSLMHPPLDRSEVATIIKSLNNKNYQYTCKESPICAHCNAVLCRTRAYGIGRGSFVNIESLSRMNTDPVIWFMDAEGHRIQMASEDIQNQIRFQRRCMETLNRMPPRMKEPEWAKLIGPLIEEATIIPVPPEGTIAGQFGELLISFCTDHSSHSTRDSILNGMAWIDEEGKLVYFRVRDLMDYLARHNFKDYKQSDVIARLKEIKGADNGFWNIKGRGVRWWGIPVFPEQTDGSDLPPMKKKEDAF